MTTIDTPEDLDNWLFAHVPPLDVEEFEDWMTEAKLTFQRRHYSMLVDVALEDKYSLRSQTAQALLGLLGEHMQWIGTGRSAFAQITHADGSIHAVHPPKDSK